MMRMQMENGDSNYWRRTSRRMLLRSSALLAGGAWAAGLAACSTRGRTGGQTQPAAGGQASAGTPKPGGIFQISSANNPPTLDPNATSSAFTHQLLGLSMGRLFQFDTGPDNKVAESWKLLPELALSSESADAITWTMKLRPDVNFHNIAPVNGHPVEAEDVKASFIRAVGPNAANRSTFDMIDPDQIQTPAKDTVVFKLRYPYAAFRNMLASGYGWISPREAGVSYDSTKQVIGSGAFVFGSYTPDVEYVVKKNPQWYEKGRPYVDGVRVAMAPDKANAIAQFGGGHLDVLGAGTGSVAIPSDDLDAIKRDSPKAAIVTAPGPNGFYIATQLSGQPSPFLDIRLRRAMSMSLDRDAMGKAVIGKDYYLQPVESRRWGKWALAWEELPPTTAQWYKQDLNQAKALLQAAGASNLTLKYLETKPQPVGQVFYGTAETSFNMLSALPWKMSLVTIDYNKDWVGGGKGVRYGNFDSNTIVLAGLEGASDVDEQLYTHFHSKSTKSVVRVKDPTLDAMIDKGRTILNEDDRVKAYKDIQKYLAEQLYGIAGFPGWFAFTAVQPWIKNWTANAGYGSGTEVFSKLWLEK
jgi:peptide/nickel transport system substrate-binding protein